MSRTIIGGVVAILIALLTAVVYIIVTSSLPAVARREARETMVRAPTQAARDGTLEALDLSKKVEAFAAGDESLRTSLNAADGAIRGQQADLAFGRYIQHHPSSVEPLLALVNDKGDIVARYGVNNPTAGDFKQDGKVVIPALDLAVKQRAVIAEVRVYQGVLYRFGVASIVGAPDPTAAPGTAGKLLGAVVVGQPLGRPAAGEQARALGTEAAYVDGGQVYATSQPNLQDALGRAMAKIGASPARVGVGGSPYLAMAVPLPQIASIDLPPGYPPVTSSLVVLVAESRDIPEHGKAGKLILLLGGLALVLSLAGMHFASKRILDQVDQLEIGIADIINGNTERTFRPVGAELDGLANSLNVMLARLLGRPDPSDDDFEEEDGTPSPVEFGEPSRAHSAAEDELAALAREPEADYYQRVHAEYRAAREAAGSPDPVSLESFTAKLRVNEGKLKAQHHCRMVRFKVVAADGKVTLKPVPIV